MSDVLVVRTTLYVSACSAQDQARLMSDALTRHGWTVGYVDVTPKQECGYVTGHLADDQPAELGLKRPGATQQQAENDVQQAVFDTGNWSAAASLSQAAAKTTKAVSDTASGLAASAQPGAEGSPLLTTARWGFVALAAVAVTVVVVVGAVYLGPLVRRGSQLAGAS